MTMSVVSPPEPATPAPVLPVRAWSRRYLGVPVHLQLRGRGVTQWPVAAAVKELFADLRSADLMFNTYRHGSVLSCYNRGELSLADCPVAARTVFDLCDEACERTEGYFTPRLTRDPDHPRCDPTGLVQAWALERAARRLDVLDDVDYCLSAGATVLTRTGEEEPPWRVDVQDPADHTRLVASLARRSGGVATAAADAAVAAAGQRRDVDPAVRSVTVMGPSLLWAGVYAAAAVARGREALQWLATRAGYAGIVVDRQGAVGLTPAWPAPVRLALA